MRTVTGPKNLKRTSLAPRMVMCSSARSDPSSDSESDQSIAEAFSQPNGRDFVIPSPVELRSSDQEEEPSPSQYKMLRAMESQHSEQAPPGDEAGEQFDQEEDMEDVEIDESQ